MTEQHPITPPPEMFKQWEGMPRSLAFEAAYRAGLEQAYDPLYKDKEPQDIIIIGGVKYKRIEEQQSFYDKLWGLLKTKLGNTIECDYMADQVRDLIREHIPEPVKNNFMSEYLLGYNEAIREVKVRLFND